MAVPVLAAKFGFLSVLVYSVGHVTDTAPECANAANLKTARCA